MGGGRSTLPGLAAIGFLSMAGQVALLRELAVASFGIELIYLLGLGLWLAAGAAGALTARGGSDPSVPSITGGFLLLAFLLPLEVLFLRGSRVLLGGVPGGFLPLGRQAVTALLGVAPASGVLGWLFARMARLRGGEGGSLASAYGWESAGGAAGSAAATLSLSLGAPNLALLLFCGGASAAVAAAGRPARRAGLLLAAVLLALLAPLRALDLATSAWNHPGVAAVADTPQGRVAVARAGGQVSVFLNDALVYESQGTEAEEFVHLAALQGKARPRSLVLGGGASGVVEELLRHSPASVEVVEGNRAMLDAVLPRLPEGAGRALLDPRVKLVFDDPRRFLATAGRYDLILVAAGDPSSGEGNRFYTREFFRLCAARLSPEGVVALRLASTENRWTSQLLMRNAAIHAALREAFPGVLVIPGGTDIMVGSAGPGFPPPEEIVRRLTERGIVSRLVTPPYLRYVLTNDRVEEAARRLKETESGPNADSRPVCYQQAVLFWLGRFLVLPEVPAGGAALVLVAASGALLALARLRPAWRRAALAGVAGFSGMAIESAVLLRFQAESGSLYQDIGLLMVSFMAGLAGGAFAFDRPAGSRASGGPPRVWGGALLAGSGAVAGGVALGAEGVGGLFRLGPAAAILALCGALTAGVFAYASRMGTGQGEIPPAPLYAADLAGGCAASLAVGLVFLPLFGAASTLAGVALLAGAAIALVW